MFWLGFVVGAVVAVLICAAMLAWMFRDPIEVSVLSVLANVFPPKK